jgi:hypothetical protein
VLQPWARPLVTRTFDLIAKLGSSEVEQHFVMRSSLLDSSKVAGPRNGKQHLFASFMNPFAPFINPYRPICLGFAIPLWADVDSRVILLTQRVLTSAAASHGSGRPGRRSRPSRPAQAGAPARKLRDTVGDGLSTLHAPGASRRV